MNSQQNTTTQDRDFKGMWIPKELYLSKDLSWSEKILLIEIDSLDRNDEKGCFASSQYLADFLGLKPTSVRNMILRLKQKGYLIELWSDGKNRGLATIFRDQKCHKKMTVKRHKKVRDVSQKNAPDVSQKSEHSNTVKEESNTVEQISIQKTPLQAAPADSRKDSVNPKTVFRSAKKFAESQAAYLARKQTEYPLIDIPALFKKYCRYCKEKERPPTRANFDSWCAEEEPPMIPPEVTGGKSYVNPRTGEGLL